MAPAVGPRPGDLVARRNRWNIAAHTVGFVVMRDDDEVLVFWSPVDGELPAVTTHLASSLITVGEDNVEQLRLRCLLSM